MSADGATFPDRNHIRRSGGVASFLRGFGCLGFQISQVKVSFFDLYGGGDTRRGFHNFQTARADIVHLGLVGGQNIPQQVGVLKHSVQVLHKLDQDFLGGEGQNGIAFGGLFKVKVILFQLANTNSQRIRFLLGNPHLLLKRSVALQDTVCTKKFGGYIRLAVSTKETECIVLEAKHGLETSKAAHVKF